MVNERSKSLKLYYSEIAKIPLLTDKQEEELIREMLKGSLRAKHKLILHHQRFVVSQAKRLLSRTSLSLEDLVNEANIGMIKAADKYQDKGFKFISYAKAWMNKEMLKAIREAKLVRLPENVDEQALKAEKYIRMFLHEHQREPDEVEIRMALKNFPKGIRYGDMTRAWAGHNSLDNPIAGEGSESFLDLMNSNSEATDKRCINNLDASLEDKIREILTEKECVVFLKSLESHTTQTSIGKEIGKSSEYVRLLLKSSREKLTTNLIV